MFRGEGGAGCAVRPCGFKSWLQHHLAVCPRANCPPSLSLHFFMCQVALLIMLVLIRLLWGRVRSYTSPLRVLKSSVAFTVLLSAIIIDTTC